MTVCLQDYLTTRRQEHERRRFMTGQTSTVGGKMVVLKVKEVGVRVRQGGAASLSSFPGKGCGAVISQSPKFVLFPSISPLLSSLHILYAL